MQCRRGQWRSQTIYIESAAKILFSVLKSFFYPKNLVIHTKIKVKCIKLTLKRQREQSLRGMKGEKRRELRRNVRNGEKKKQFFFLIDWGAKEQEKRKKLEVMVPTKKPQSWEKEKKKIQKIVGGATTNVAPPLGAAALKY
jgi:hypothetical protein